MYQRWHTKNPCNFDREKKTGLKLDIISSLAPQLQLHVQCTSLTVIWSACRSTSIYFIPVLPQADQKSRSRHCDVTYKMWSHTFTAFYNSHSQLYSSEGRNVSSNKEVYTFWLQKSMVMWKKRWRMYNNWNYYPVRFLWSEQLKMFSYSTYPFSLWSRLSISAVTSAISALRRCNKLVENIFRERQLLQWSSLHRLETFTLHLRTELLQKNMASFCTDWNYSDFHQRRIQSLSNNRMRVDYDWLVSIVLNTVADPGEGPGGPVPPLPLFLDQNEAERAKKDFFETGAPFYLKVWIRHWNKTFVDSNWCFNNLNSGHLQIQCELYSILSVGRVRLLIDLLIKLQYYLLCVS